MIREIIDYVPKPPVDNGQVIGCSFVSENVFDEKTSKYSILFIVDVKTKIGDFNYAFNEQSFAIQFYDLIVTYMERN